MPRYNPSVIEPKWQQFWEQNQTFKTPKLPKGRKLYVLDMFPYPSGNGLHVGHPEGYTATDIVCRFSRMQGVSVMHPMGWDAFGLPAEQHAKKTGTHPRVTTETNTDTFRRQLKMLGFSYDWDRELATTDVDYFRWTQFIFLVLFDTWFDEEQQRGRPMAELPIPHEITDEGEEAVERYRDEHRLAYQLEAPVNWCPALGTVLANEEVVGGVSERGGHPVVRIPLRQWMLRITAYADRLEKDLDALDWSESIKLLQRNWIGRSTGAEVDFFIGSFLSADGKPSEKEYRGWLADRAYGGWPRKPEEDVLRIYTTRPDTLFGATYMVIAPEHPFVERLTQPEQAAAVREYCEKSTRKSDLDRTDLAKEKTGVFTGSYAINPVNGEAIPIWIADYVLISYGTGAIMAVPAHDTRDFEFAKVFNLPIIPVVDPGAAADVPRDDLLAGNVAFIADGTVINSGPYNGLTTAEFKKKIVEDLGAKGIGREAVNYKLRDWLFSRQHFWGEPFPILHELDENDQPTGRVRALTPEDLPLDLPAEMKFDAEHASPQPPLEEAPTDWLYVSVDGKRYKRETNTMPQWAGSCWYYLRFLDPKNDRALVDPADRKGVDAGRSVRRRRGARRVAFAVRPVLAQGALRPRLRQHGRAVPEARQPGNDPGRDGIYRLSDCRREVRQRGRGPRERRRAAGLSNERRVGHAGEAFARASRKARRRVRLNRRQDDSHRKPGVQNGEIPWQRDQSRSCGQGIRGRFAAALRDVHGSARGREAVEHGRGERRAELLNRVWRMIIDDRVEESRFCRAFRTFRPRPSRTACCTRPSRR